MTSRGAKLDALEARLALARSSFRKEETSLDSIQKNLQAASEAQQLLQASASAVQSRAHARIAHIVTRCLKTVFGPEAYDFEIRFEQKRGKTEARCVFIRDGSELDPISSAGGGVIDVVSMALRLACLLLTTPKRRRLLCLDEPMRMVSKEYRPLVAQLLLQLAQELDLQLILCTHHPDLAIGKVITLD